MITPMLVAVEWRVGRAPDLETGPGSELPFLQAYARLEVFTLLHLCFLLCTMGTIRPTSQTCCDVLTRWLCPIDGNSDLPSFILRRVSKNEDPWSLFHSARE